jgi:hypothetical protein
MSALATCTKRPLRYSTVFQELAIEGTSLSQGVKDERRTRRVVNFEEGSRE